MKENCASLAKSVTYLCNEKAALLQKVEELERKVEAANKAARQSRANEVKSNRKLQELSKPKRLKKTHVHPNYSIWPKL